MNSSFCRWSKGEVRREAMRLGAVAFGCAVAGEVEQAFRDAYRRWIAAGRHGTMDYLAKYDNVRFDPRCLLPGARTVISMAFPYRPAGGYHHPNIADYALGEDYHRVVKLRLASLARFILDNYGAQSRSCVDTAPLPERYWAQRAGLGWRGLNGQLIVPGVGSGVFLGELVTTLELEADKPLSGDCGRCGACIAACPGRAFGTDGFDSRRCLSYLTIEHRGTIPEDIEPGNVVYGCDACQRVCPHNLGEPPEPLAEFNPDPRLLKLDKEVFGHLSGGDWRRLTACSAMSRVKFVKIKEILKINKN